MFDLTEFGDIYDLIAIERFRLLVECTFSRGTKPILTAHFKRNSFLVYPLY